MYAEAGHEGPRFTRCIQDRNFWISLVGVEDSRSLSPGPRPLVADWGGPPASLGRRTLQLAAPWGSPGGSGSELRCRAFQGQRALPGPPSWGPGVPLWHEYRSGSTLAPVQDPVSWSLHPIIFILRTQGRCPAHTTASAPGPGQHL